MKNKFKFLATMLIGVLLSTNVWGGEVTLTSQQIKAGTGSSSYSECSATDGDGNTWSAYAQKNQHSNATSDYHFWGINSSYYVHVPEMPGKITQLEITVSNNGKPRGEGGNTQTLYFSNSSSTSSTGTGVVSGTGSSTVTLNTSSLNLTSGYITSSGFVRIWDVVVTYESATPATHYTVSFYNNGDYVGEFTTATYNGKEYLDELPDMSSASFPHPTSTTFAGWTTDEINGETQTTITADNLVDTYTEITEDISVNALWASVDSDHKVTFTASVLSQSPVGGYYDWTIDGINFYYKSTAGTIYNSSYFEVSAGNRFTVDAGNRIINKIDFTVYSATYCIGSMTDGSLSEVFDTNKQTATNINAYYTQGIAPDDNEADFSQMAVTCYTDYITHYTACSNEVNVNKGSMTGGDITINADKVCADDGGGSVTVTPNPDAHYSCTGVTATVGSVTGPVAGVYTVSGITAATTISATFVEAAKYTVTWKVKGVTVKSTQVYVGETDAAPAVTDADIPTDCADAFVGWSISTLTGTGHGAPPDLFNTTSPEITADRTFNAVFATAAGGESTVLPSRAGTITSGDYYIVDRYTGKNNQGTSVDYYAGLQGGLINVTSGGIYVKELPAAGYEIEGNIFTLKLDQIADANKPSAYHVDVANDGITIGFGGQTFYSQFNGSIYADMKVSGDYICKWTAITNEDGGKHMLKITKGDLNSCLLLMDHTQSGNDAHYCKNNDVARCGSGGTISGVNAYGSGHMYFIPAVSVTYSNYVTSCATYTVTFKSNSADVTTVSNVAPGQQVTAPTLAYIKSKVAAKNVCTNYLVGWSTNSHYTNPSAAPSDILKPNAESKITIPSDITGDVTYYAVYADVVQQ